MLVVKTKLKEFPGKGIGLVADEAIRQGQVVWKFHPVVDIEIDESTIPEEMEAFYGMYAVGHEDGKLLLNTDNARFINHSQTPNIRSLGPRKDNVAIQNIEKGEEITINYSEIDINDLDFEEV